MYLLSDVEQFILELYPDSTNIALLGKGGHSHAYSFETKSKQLVIRFSKHSEDFEKDMFANRFTSESIPIPRLIKIGAAFDGHFAISQKREGEMLDELKTAQVESVIPSIFKLLDALRTADISGTSGYGGFDASGNGGCSSWSKHLLESLEDSPEKRNGGWYKILQNSKYGTKVFDEGLAAFKKLSNELPNVRHLIHYDLLNRNVMVKNNEISSVFDWGCGRYGDFLFELACFTFWAPLIEGYKDFDWKLLAQRHYLDIGLEVPDLENRLLTYELFIGLEHLGYNASIGNWENYAQTQNQVTKILESIKILSPHITLE